MLSRPRIGYGFPFLFGGRSALFCYSAGPLCNFTRSPVSRLIECELAKIEVAKGDGEKEKEIGGRKVYSKRRC